MHDLILDSPCFLFFSLIYVYLVRCPLPLPLPPAWPPYRFSRLATLLLYGGSMGNPGFTPCQSTSKVLSKLADDNSRNGRHGTMAITSAQGNTQPASSSTANFVRRSGTELKGSGEPLGRSCQTHKIGPLQVPRSRTHSYCC